MHDSYRPVLGKFTKHGGMHSNATAVEDVEQYTLERLGKSNDNSHQQQQEDETTSMTEEESFDFIWFGITERMSESMCLFYYTFRLQPSPSIPNARVMDCKPSSWWTDEDRAE
eukprot:6135628-Ditylum_brightwellii.AAC.1